jgi:hypothetical protein
VADPLYLCFFPVFSAGLSFWFFCEALDSEFVKVEREREREREREAAFVCFFNEEGDGKHDDDKKEMNEEDQEHETCYQLPIVIELPIEF